jgi:hypothetical protein
MGSGEPSKLVPNRLSSRAAVTSARSNVDETNFSPSSHTS